MQKPLAKRQREVVEFIRRFVALQGHGPTLQEIADHFGLRSVSTVHGLVSVLEAKGHLRRKARTGRSLEVIDPEAVWRPVRGQEFTIPSGARYVPVAVLPMLFKAWLRRRQIPATVEFSVSPTGEVPHG